MAELQPYISIDLETTGLSIKESKLLQIAAVYDDGKTPIDQLPHINILINNGPSINYVEVGALALHEKTKLFSRISAAYRDGVSKNPTQAIDALLNFIENHRPIKEEAVYEPPRRPDEEHGSIIKAAKKYKIALAGKNAGTFDIPLLKERMNAEQKKKFDRSVNHSVIDAGSIYFTDFGRIPSLGEILSKLPNERKEVLHDALSDSLDVVTAIRHKMKISSV